MKKLLTATAILAAGAMVFAAGKKETIAVSGGNENISGKVVIYTSMYQDIIDTIDQQLEELFPNCDVEFFQGGTGTLQAKIAAEKDSGKL